MGQCLADLSAWQNTHQLPRWALIQGCQEMRPVAHLRRAAGLGSPNTLKATRAAPRVRMLPLATVSEGHLTREVAWALAAAQPPKARHHLLNSCAAKCLAKLGLHFL